MEQSVIRDAERANLCQKAANVDWRRGWWPPSLRRLEFSQRQAEHDIAISWRRRLRSVALALFVIGNDFGLPFLVGDAASKASANTPTIIDRGLVSAGMVRLHAFNLAQRQHEPQQQGRGF
jgi:hypothetical protein